MIHNMKLNNEPYNSILYGKKDIEMRLNDEKRKKIKVGDYIIFTNRDTMDSFKTIVVGLHKFNDFKSLYNSFDKVRLGYMVEQDSYPEDMEQYYSRGDINKYGVLGIEIRLIKF